MAKRILITGASSGIGEALARLAVQNEYAVVGLARRKHRLEDLRDQLGPRFEPCAADLELPESETLIRSLGRFDAVVANAGRGSTIMPLDLETRHIHDMVQANVITVMHTLRGALPEMMSAGKGTILIVGSILGRVPYAPWRAAYSAAKAALLSLAASCRQQLLPLGIQVCVVNPGLTDTEFQQTANPEGKPLPPLNFGRSPSPGAIPQTSAQVAETIFNVLENPRDEAYTREEIATVMADRYVALSNGTDPIRGLLIS